MSFKLQDRIQSIKGLPGKYKRVLLAFARRAKNDGTNVYAAKETLADLAGVERTTVYRNLPDLIEVGVVVEADSHVCSNKDCAKDNRHYCGNGHYTVAYNIDVAMLQNATLLVEKLRCKMQLSSVAKCNVGSVAKCNAKRGYKEKPTPFAPLTPLGSDDEASALTRGIDLSTDQSQADLKSQSKTVVVQTPTASKAVGSEAEDKANPTPDEFAIEMPLSGVTYNHTDVVLFMADCWSAFNRTAPNADEVRLFTEVLLRCDENTCFPSDPIKWAQTHISNPRLLGGLRSVKGLHKAICGADVSSTNGLLAQFKDHDPKACGVCVKAKANGASHVITKEEIDAVEGDEPIMKRKGFDSVCAECGCIDDEVNPVKNSLCDHCRTYPLKPVATGCGFDVEEA